MKLIIKIVIGLALCFFSFAGFALTKGCDINMVVQNEKKFYSANDTITLLVKVKLDTKFCAEAGSVTKVFGKGLKIINRSEWKRLSETTLGQKLTLTVLNKGKEKILTVYRKTAHYNCFEQKIFKTRE